MMALQWPLGNDLEDLFLSGMCPYHTCGRVSGEFTDGPGE